MKNRAPLLLLCSLLMISGASAAEKTSEANNAYVILVSEATWKAPDWEKVVHSLKSRHPNSRVQIYLREPGESLAALRELSPRWLCWVAQPGELGTAAVKSMHAVARGLDDDPYTDCFWGIVTGRDGAAAKAQTEDTPPLLVRHVVGGTEFDMASVEQGKWFSELKQGEVWSKAKGAAPAQTPGEKDSTVELVRAFTEGKPDAILTSGHATEDNWEPGFAYKNGRFIHEAGVVTGVALDGSRHPVDSPNPKVYLGIGNCLIGNVPGKADCMATAWMNKGGVRQFFGYTVPTWYGYAGWGVLDYFIEQPGRYSLTESVFANLHALDWRLNGGAPELTAQDKAGLKHDRDVVVLMGDPKWEARLAPGPLRWTEEFTETPDGEFIWVIEPKAGEQTFATVNKNGSQRGGRPLVRFLPRKVAGLKVTEGSEWKPVVGDDFILLPRPTSTPAKITLRFRMEKN